MKNEKPIKVEFRNHSAEMKEIVTINSLLCEEGACVNHYIFYLDSDNNLKCFDTWERP